MTQGQAGPVKRSTCRRALRDLEPFVAELPETGPVSVPPPQEASAGTADDEYMRELVTSVLGESKSDEQLPEHTKTPIQKSKPVSAPALGEPAVKDDTDTSEGRLALHRGRLGPSPVALLPAARGLMEPGTFQEALRPRHPVAGHGDGYLGM